ncbi:resolvase family site-specific recombinase [Roseibium sp. TrichSKD4]|uniref:recombinase family protein n=1 Tax=Roseibium sp. TrichSKD4 TaxID=744980 RepID=UPI0001E57572|nr:recombinase family protein [Roseibium sp. TrichSKD4]EFO29967.1 resolvase family site-specific recombinase [Roseibium sp. TrichSKD4]
MRRVRCAIYTRKSSEEGLEQGFNSLDAQREACASYIASQKHEGWELIKKHYDDGGVSGGTLERPALRQLLRDVEEGEVDQIVVYKIDRLTRSLADFAKLVERLDGAGASFVSVTQSFNTSTSMGRLTLNVLLSFAQFEREVTAERIRDKIAASKKKGLWMGGTVPLGYRPDGRSLRIVPAQAETIRSLFDLYLEHGSINAVQTKADELGLTRPAANRKTETTQLQNGKEGVLEEKTGFARSHLHYILSNPVYAGLIRHGDKTHEGQHEAIIERDTWTKVQDMLQGEARKKRGRSRKQKRSGAAGEQLGFNGKGSSATTGSGAIMGKLFDETGDRLTPHHVNKKGRIYRYYVSNRLLAGRSRNAEFNLVAGNNSELESPTQPNTRHPVCSGWRLSAPKLEETIARAIKDHLRKGIAGSLLTTPQAELIAHMHQLLEMVSTGQSSKASNLILQMVRRGDLAPGTISLALDGVAVARFFDCRAVHLNPDVLTFDVSFQIRKRGVETKLVVGGEQSTAVDPTLVHNIALGHRICQSITAGTPLEEICEKEGLSRRRLLQLVDHGLLAPDLVRKVLEGHQPVGLTSEWLQRHALPLDWQEQRRVIGLL